MPITQPMKALETSCQLRPGLLAELGLQSVQDVVSHTEAEFTHRLAGTLGPTAASTLYRTARAAEQQLIKLLHQAAARLTTEQPTDTPAPTPSAFADSPELGVRLSRMARAAGPQVIQVPDYAPPGFISSDPPRDQPPASPLVGSVFDANSPTWMSQFPQKTTLVAPGSIGDSSAPASYATSLYSLALQLEAIAPADNTRITLATRRPELGDTLLSDVTVNKPLAKLDIVTGALQTGLEGSKNNQALIKTLQDQGVLPASVKQLSCDALLARLHFPGHALPYHEPHDQIVSALAEHGSGLAQLTQQVRASRPAFCFADGAFNLSNRVLQQAALLSPALSSLVSKAPPTAAQSKAFFSYNFGVATSSGLNKLPNFCAATGLSIDEVMALLCVAGLGSQNTSVVASIHVSGQTAAPHLYGAVLIHGGKQPDLFLKQDNVNNPISIEGLDDDRYDRLNRLIRLQRQTDLPFAELDTVLVAAMHAEGQHNAQLTLNTHSVRTLGFYQLWNGAYGLKAEELSAFLHQVAVCSVGTAVPQFDRVFNPRGTSESALKIDGAAFVYHAPEGNDAVCVRQLCAGLNVSETEFLLLAGYVNNVQKLDKNHLVRSVTVLSALYRLSRIPALLGIRVADMIALSQLMPRGNALLTQLAGIAQLAELDANGQPKHADLLDDLQALAEMVSWLKNQKLSVTDLMILLAPTAQLPAAGAKEVALVNDINQHLGNIRLNPTTLQNAGLPATDTNGLALHWLALLSDETTGLVDPHGLVKIEAPQARTEALKSILNTLKLSDSNKADALEILQARLDGLLRNQQALTDTQFGKFLGVEHGTVAAMLACLGLNSHDLLATCQTLNKPPLSPADIPSTLMQTLQKLARYSLVVAHYALTPAGLNLMSAVPSAFGANLTLSLNLLPVLSDFVAWRQAAGKEDAVLQYLRDVNGTAPPSAADANARLATVLDAETNEVQQAVDLITQSAPGTGRAATVTEVSHLIRLLGLAEKTGLSINLLRQLTELDSTEGVLPDTATDDTAFATWRVAALALMATLDLATPGAN